MSARNEQKMQELARLLADVKTREKAFAMLVEQTRSQLYWHIRRMVLVHEDADDVLQNAYLKAWRSIDTFRGESSLSTWLYRIATNETLTFMAQQRMRNVMTSIDYEDLMLSRMEADTYYDGDQMQRKFRQAVLQLPEKQRLVFNMRYYDDMKYEQIAEITGTSEGALKASYHIAVKKIEQFILNSD
ncbi:MAG: RNA polymerase sigma factor [Candidatus Aphodosoma sp.]